MDALRKQGLAETFLDRRHTARTQHCARAPRVSRRPVDPALHPRVALRPTCLQAHGPTRFRGTHPARRTRQHPVLDIRLPSGGQVP